MTPTRLQLQRWQSLTGDQRERVLAHGPLAIHAAMASGGGRHFEDMKALTDAVRAHLPQCASIAVKGSRFMRMEQVVEALTATSANETEGAHAA